MKTVDRRIDLLVLSIINVFILISSLLLVGRILWDQEDLLGSTSFIVMGALVIWFNLSSIIISIVLLVFLRKENNEKIRKGLIVNALFSWTLIPSFTMYFYYRDSGLSKANRLMAIEYLNTSNMHEIVEMPDVKKQINANKELKRKIANIQSFIKENIEDEYDANAIILRLLKEYKVKFKVNYDPEHVYKLGNSLYNA